MHDSITQSDLLLYLYGRYVDPFSTGAKATANLVRGKINDYYGGVGKDDLVRIDLPPGPGYRPTFTYHTEAAAIRAYKKALAYKERLSIFALSEAEYLLEEAIELAPAFAAAHAALAEIFLLRLIMDSIIEMYPGTAGWGSHARKSSEDALRLNSDLWLGHIVLGMLSLFSSDEEQAEIEFQFAMRSDPDRTKTSLWYATYLVYVGRHEEGLQIAKSRTRDLSGNAETHLVYAFLLYVTRQYDVAINVLYEVAGVEIVSALQDLTSILIDMAVGRTPQHTPFRLIQLSLQIDKQWVNPTTSLQSSVHVMSEEALRAAKSAIFPKIPAGDRKMPDTETYTNATFLIRNPDYNPEARFPGLQIYSLVTAGDIKLAKEKMSDLENQPLMKPLELAIGYLGVGSLGKAIEFFFKARREGDIATSWLRLLPLFDPLRRPIYLISGTDK